MESDAKNEQRLIPSKPTKFSVYQNPALASAWTAASLRPSKYVLFFIVSLSSASSFCLLSFFSGEKQLVSALTFGNLSDQAAYFFARVLQALVSLVFLGTIIALAKAISLHRKSLQVKSPSKGAKDQLYLTNRQLELLGIKPKFDQVASESSKKPPKAKPSQSSEPLFPLHQSITSSGHKSEKSGTRNGNKVSPFGTSSSKTPASPSSFYLVHSSGSPLSAARPSPGQDKVVSSPWSNKRAVFKDITTEEQLEQLLAEIDEKITESAGKMSTPPPTIGSFSVAGPNVVAGSASASGTTRSTPLRPVRLSPASQKFTTPPKKGEGEFPSPMSLEEAIEGFERMGIYPQIEYWRDSLRQWFSSDLLKPLLNKTETSHIQVMQAAAKLGFTITVSQVGSDLPNGTNPTTPSPGDRTNGWQPAYSLDEDGLLHQLRANLVQTIDVCMQKLRLQQSDQQTMLMPTMQECVDAITEHQRLQALMKGEWVKGLLPHSSILADCIVQRIRELAEGTCVKSYEYIGSGESRDKNKKWALELPTDSHLLLYLFCAFLEHPKWMLHVDPSSYSGTHSSKNPLFLGVLPPKERFPEKYIAIISGVPLILHPGASVLVVGKQSPPIFALYWDKKLQFSLQGRTALWDSILVLCYRIKVGYGGIVRGMHLASSALNILPVLDSETQDS